MATVTVRSLPDEVHRALRVRAASHNRSTEAEIRVILEAAVLPAERVHPGEALAELGRRIGFTDDELSALQRMRSKVPAEPVSFE